jgi:serine/threonine protein kinase/regulator of sirC expression with transglutaminase-like and TPR domain
VIERDTDEKETIKGFGWWHIGDLIDRHYEVRRILKGGMGVIYACIDHKTSGLFAVKTFQDKYLLDKEARKRFVREAETWIRLKKHKNIVEAYWVQIYSGKPHIFLEYVPSSRDGKSTLWDYILRLDLDKALNIAIQFCDGIIFATTFVESLVHRDIKPKNIMITPDGVVKITDFGLVKALGAPTNEKPMGTPEYMSPEQFHTMDVDTRSDIYSFGVVLYEMIIGRPPFWTEDEEERWRFCEKQHINTIPKNPRSINSNIPVNLDSLVMKCLEKKPKDRYQSFENLRQILDQIYFEIFGQHVLPTYTGPIPEAWELSNKGISLVQLGRVDEGIASLKHAIELDSNCTLAYVNLGAAYADKGWIDQAITEYKHAIDLDPKRVETHINLGNAYYRKGWTNQAITEYKHAIDLYPKDAWAYYNLADVYGKEGWIDQAIIELKKAIELDPHLSAAYCDLGAAYSSKGWLDQAITEFKQALNLNPNEAEAHYNIGETYGKKGWLDQAIMEFKQTIELNPNHAKAHGDIGYAYHRKGWIDQAIGEFKKAIELDANIANFHVNLGLAYCDKSWLDQAIIEFKRAAELDPTNPIAHRNLGAAYYNKGWLDQAIMEFKQTIELNPNDAVAHFNLAVAYYDSRRFDLAWKHVRIAEKLGVPTRSTVQLITLLGEVSREP